MRSAAEAGSLRLLSAGLAAALTIAVALVSPGQTGGGALLLLTSAQLSASIGRLGADGLIHSLAAKKTQPVGSVVSNARSIATVGTIVFAGLASLLLLPGENLVARLLLVPAAVTTAWVMVRADFLFVTQRPVGAVFYQALVFPASALAGLLAHLAASRPGELGEWMLASVVLVSVLALRYGPQGDVQDGGSYLPTLKLRSDIRSALLTWPFELQRSLFLWLPQIVAESLDGAETKILILRLTALSSMVIVLARNLVIPGAIQASSRSLRSIQAWFALCCVIAILPVAGAVASVGVQTAALTSDESWLAGLSLLALALRGWFVAGFTVNSALGMFGRTAWQALLGIGLIVVASPLMFQSSDGAQLGAILLLVALTHLLVAGCIDIRAARSCRTATG